MAKIQKGYAAFVEIARRIAGEEHADPPGIFVEERAK
jgi:hypothetical protein